MDLTSTSDFEPKLNVYDTECVFSPSEIAVVDSEGGSSICGVLVVPQGREHEFSFSTEEGCRELASSSSFQRLIFVSLSRGHRYKVRVRLFSLCTDTFCLTYCVRLGFGVSQSLQSIQKELDVFVRQLAPAKAQAPGASIPYLTPSAAEDIGTRLEVCVCICVCDRF